MLISSYWHHLTQPKQPAKNLIQQPVLASKAVPSYEEGSAVLKARHCRAHQNRLLENIFGWLFWLSEVMSIAGYEHLIQQLDSDSWIPLYSTAFPKLNIQNMKWISLHESRWPPNWNVGSSNLSIILICKSLHVILIDLISSLIRWSSTPKPT